MRERGLLADAGKPLPFIDRAVFSLEKESIPYWNKFLQGYYDASGISSDTFDQAVAISGQGDIGLTDAMQDKGIRLATSVAPSDIYMGFNMLDPVVGGDGERARKLRQAISIAMDYEEYIAHFRERPWHTGARADPAGNIRPPGRRCGHQPLRVRLDRRQAANASRYPRRSGCSPRRATRTASTVSPGSLLC